MPRFAPNCARPRRTWPTAAGSRVRWRWCAKPRSARCGCGPFETQLLGASLLLAGKLAEMQTGEGKTLTAGLAAAVAACAGRAGACGHRQRLPGRARRRRAGAAVRASRPARRRGRHRHEPGRAPPGLPLRHHLLHRQGTGLRLPEGQAWQCRPGRSGAHLRPSTSGSRPAATTARCCAACTSRSSTRPTASSSTRRARR